MGWFWGSKKNPSLANPGALIVSLFLSCDVNENHVSRLTLYYVQGPGRGRYVHNNDDPDWRKVGQRAEQPIYE